MRLRAALILLIPLSLLLVFGVSRSERITIQGNNEVRWADGLERLSGRDWKKRYFENRLNLDLYYQDFRLGTRLTSLQPSEFGEYSESKVLLEKKFLEYSDPRGIIGFRAGDFYTVWGRGLSLALVEDIYQGFDSGLEGFLGKANYSGVHAEALSGRSRAGFLGNVREARVNGVHLEAGLLSGVKLGGQALLVEPIPDAVSYKETRDWGGYLAYDGSYLSVWAEHLREYVTGKDDNFEATYLSLSGFFGPLGISLDYKNYNYYLSSSISQGSGYSQTVNIIAYHSPPIVQREITSNLFGKHPHVVRYDDEIGVQLELTYSLDALGSAIFALSQSSVHPNEDAWLPTLEEVDSPYREAFLEFDLYPASAIYLVGWAGYSEELIYSTIGAQGRDTWQRRNALGGKVEFPLIPELMGMIYAEGLYVDDIKREEKYLEALFTTGVIFRSNYNLSLTLETTGQEDPTEGRDTWINIQGRAFLADRHELLFTVGQERGGLICTSGKCRQVFPFNGVKITLTSLF